jgi:DNA-directed RNA polymerase specialized sigma24 family protein
MRFIWPFFFAKSTMAGKTAKELLAMNIKQRKKTDKPSPYEGYPAEIRSALEESDREMELNERRETRRHVSYHNIRNVGGPDGDSAELAYDFIDPKVDIEGDYIANENFNRLVAFIRTLPPSQQKLTVQLFSGMSVTEIADTNGTSKAAVVQQRKRLQEQVRKFRENF